MRFALRLAWRDLRARPGRFFLFICSVATAIAALLGVHGASQALAKAVAREARSLLAADVQATAGQAPSPQAVAAVAALANRWGGRYAQVAEMATVVTPGAATGAGGAAGAPDDATGGGGAAAALVELKAVGPGYPFYGDLVTDPPGPRPAPGTALVAQELLDRLGLQVGDRLQVGKLAVRIAGRVLREPDRPGLGLAAGPRVLIDHRDLPATGLVAFGSRVRHGFLIQVPEGTDLDAVRASLAQALGPGWRIRDHRQPPPGLQRALDRVGGFLGLASLVALAAGGVGVAHAARWHLLQSLDTLAICRCLGATPGQVVLVQALQALVLGLVGGALGSLAGLGVQAALPRVAGPFLGVDLPLAPDPRTLAQGLALGAAVALVFSAGPVLAAGRVPPLWVFRRDLAGGVSLAGTQVTAAGVAALFLAAVAAWLAPSPRWALGFLAGLGGAAAAAGALGWALLRGARGLAVRLFRPGAGRLAAALAHGLRNLHRPGGQAPAAVLALALGVAAVGTVHLIQQGVLDLVRRAGGPDSPNLVFLGIQQDQAGAFRAWLAAQPGVAGGDLIPLVQARLVAVNGRGPGEGADQGLWNRNWTLTWAADLPAGDEVVAGRWWDADAAAQGPLASVEEEVAQRLGAGVGSTLTFESEGRRVTATVANLRRVDWARVRASFYVILSPGALDGFATQYTALVRADPGRHGLLVRDVASRFPGVSALSVADILAAVQAVVDRLAAAVRLLAGFAAAAGLVILAGGVAATRHLRLKDAAVLRALGATPWQVAAALAAEHGAQGILAGAAGAAVAHGVAWALARLWLDLPAPFSPVLLVGAPLACAALTAVTGTLAAWDALVVRPLAVLRGE